MSHFQSHNGGLFKSSLCSGSVFVWSKSISNLIVLHTKTITGILLLQHLQCSLEVSSEDIITNWRMLHCLLYLYEWMIVMYVYNILNLCTSEILYWQRTGLCIVLSQFHCGASITPHHNTIQSVTTIVYPSLLNISGHVAGMVRILHCQSSLQNLELLFCLLKEWIWTKVWLINLIRAVSANQLYWPGM